MPARIESLTAGQPLDSFFVLASLREGVTKSGSRFLTLSLSDSTGTVTGRVWSPETACAEPVDAPAIVWVRGRIESYRDELQLNIETMRVYRPQPDEYDALVQASRWTEDTLVQELRLHIETVVRAAPLRRLLLAALDHPTVRERFGNSPAASGNHHAYRSGLAEHTLSMMRLGTQIAEHYAAYYPGMVDGDLLVAGALLHDLGKVWELQGELTTEYSTVGRLVGHIPMGATFVSDLARELGDIPETLVWELQHLVLSHHGELEFGSPKRPKTLEAQLLHFIDMIDARTNTFVHEAKNPGWTGYLRNFERPLLNPVALRAAWTEPPPGEASPQGPGGRAPAVDAALTARHEQPTAVAVATVHDAETARVPRAKARAEGAGSRHKAEPPAPAGNEDPAPATRPLQRTLSIFDGLDPE